MKNFVKFINEEHVAMLCGEKEDIHLIVDICAKFCVSKFGLEACAQNPMEVNNFCVSTLISAKAATKNKKLERGFDIKKDLYNELTLACQRGENHLPVINYMKVAKKRCFFVANKENCSIEDELTFFNEDLFLSLEIFTQIELILLLQEGGNITLYSLVEDYKFKKAEAEAIRKNIRKKIIFLRTTF